MPASEQRFPQLTLVTPKDRPLRLAHDAFLIAQEAARHSPLTLRWYEHRLGRFLAFLAERSVTAPERITPTDCRMFLVELQHTGLANNTLHGFAQAVKTFCRFMEREGYAPTNAFARVTMPKVGQRLMPALTPDDVKRLLTACETPRDCAVVLCLLDSGARASEFCALRLADVDLRVGTVRIAHGKGDKARACYLGAKSRRALLVYLRSRPEATPTAPLWVSENTGQALTDWGLRQLLRRLGRKSGVGGCTPHAFRRSCALWSLRGGMSVYHVQALLGHQDLTTTRRYLALVESDAQEAHRRFGPVDNML